MTSEQWIRHIRAQRSSGLSQAKYCAEHGLSESSMSYQTKKLSGHRGKAGEFVSVSTVGRPMEVAIGNAVVRVTPGSDLAELRRIVEALS